MSKKDNRHDIYAQELIDIAHKMIDECWSYSIIWLLNLISELQEKINNTDNNAIITELRQEAWERNQEIETLYKEINLLKQQITNLKIPPSRKQWSP